MILNEIQEVLVRICDKYILTYCGACRIGAKKAKHFYFRKIKSGVFGNMDLRNMDLTKDK